MTAMLVGRTSVVIAHRLSTSESGQHVGASRGQLRDSSLILRTLPSRKSLARIPRRLLLRVTVRLFTRVDYACSSAYPANRISVWRKR